MNTRSLENNKINALYYVRFHLPMIRVHMINIESFASVVESSPYIYVAKQVRIVRGMSESNDGWRTNGIGRWSGQPCRATARASRATRRTQQRLYRWVLPTGDMLHNVIFPLFIPDDTALQEPDLTNCIRCTRSFDSNNPNININRSDDVRPSQGTSIFGTVDQHLEERMPVKWMQV